MSTLRELPSTLYSAEQVRELDRIAIQERGIAGATLMARAGSAAYAVLCKRWPQARVITIVCGTGNNAGDGYVVAALARQAKKQVQLLQLGDVSRLSGDALDAYRRMRRTGVVESPFDPAHLAGCDVVVDAIFGTGLDREVGGRWRDAITAVNASAKPVLAIDIPSGLHATRGEVLGVAVRASATVTFIGLKLGLFTGAGRGFCGAVEFAGLEVPEDVFAGVSPTAVRLDSQGLAKREPTAHKGQFGHVLVIGGDLGFAGAARLAGEAAARVGAGLVSVATRPEHASAVVGARPELMCRGVSNPGELADLAERATVLALGPGLGQSAWSTTLFGAALATELPMVVDADALNLLARAPRRRADWVLTPHPGEAARLLDTSTRAVQSDRLAAVRALVERYGGVCVLKGSGTLVFATDAGVGLSAAGNPGMATGGMGDVLTGVIAGLVAQGLTPVEAAREGVCLHAEAADQAALAGERGLLAGDLMPPLRSLVNASPI